MAITAIQGIARRFIPAMLKQGLSASAGLRMLRDQGLGYRRTNFLSDWREISGLERKRGILRHVPKKYKPPERVIQRTAFKQKARFLYNYKIEGYDIVTKQYTTEWISVASDDLITIEQAEEEAKRLADIYKVDIDIAKMIIDGVTVRK